MSWPCFWVERTGDAEISLRRYSRSDDGCPAGGSYHNVSVAIGRFPLLLSDRDTIAALYVEDYGDRPEWPSACACGYAFTEDDERQVNQEAICRADDGREWPHKSLPVGAMQDAAWLKPFGVGPDGIALVVVLPPEADDSRGQWWHVDGPSRNNGVPGSGWTRTGDPRVPPTLNVNPSILTSDYHGWLHNHELSDPL
jgi:hypothetical protein